MKLGIVTGEHGNEGTEFISDLLEKEPVDGVVQKVANPLAVAAGRRYRDKNIAHCYPGRPRGSTAIEEEACAHEVLAWAEEEEVDALFAIHHALYPGEDAMYANVVYTDWGVGQITTSPETLVLGGMMGIKKVVLMNKPNMIIAHHRRSAVVDIAPDSPLWRPGREREWRCVLREMVNDGVQHDIPDLKFYAHRKTLKLAEQAHNLPKSMPGFSWIGSALSRQLPDVQTLPLALSWGEQSSGYAEVVEELIPHDDGAAGYYAIRLPSGVNTCFYFEGHETPAIREAARIAQIR